ncbi:hypothetical protein HanIR_Chr09g0404161 [Helianthus annuus]|nr:hypothetical protein HanIR_Chr09g0404161 [Helianthus annuus]
MQDSYYPPFATVCGQCGVVEPKYLHHVRHCATFRRLCTTCVLRLHPQCFCPTCPRSLRRFATNRRRRLLQMLLILPPCLPFTRILRNRDFNNDVVSLFECVRVVRRFVAANEAVKRAEEAANARKSAGEALDHLARLMVKEKSDKKVGHVGAGVGVVDVSHMDNVDGKGDVSGKVLEPLNAVELEVGKEVVKDDMLVKVVENGQEHCCGDVVVV